MVAIWYLLDNSKTLPTTSFISLVLWLVTIHTFISSQPTFPFTFFFLQSKWKWKKVRERERREILHNKKRRTLHGCEIVVEDLIMVCAYIIEFKEPYLSYKATTSEKVTIYVVLPHFLLSFYLLYILFVWFEEILTNFLVFQGWTIFYGNF